MAGSQRWAHETPHQGPVDLDGEQAVPRDEASAGDVILLQRLSETGQAAPQVGPGAPLLAVRSEKPGEFSPVTHPPRWPDSTAARAPSFSRTGGYVPPRLLRGAQQPDAQSLLFCQEARLTSLATPPQRRAVTGGLVGSASIGSHPGCRARLRNRRHDHEAPRQHKADGFVLHTWEPTVAFENAGNGNRSLAPGVGRLGGSGGALATALAGTVGPAPRGVRGIEATARRFGRARLALSEVVGGVVVIYLESEDLARALRGLATPDTPFDSWLDAQVRALFGCQLARPSRVSGDLLFAWRWGKEGGERSPAGIVTAKDGTEGGVSRPRRAKMGRIATRGPLWRATERAGDPDRCDRRRLFDWSTPARTCARSHRESVARRTPPPP